MRVHQIENRYVHKMKRNHKSNLKKKTYVHKTKLFHTFNLKK